MADEITTVGFEGCGQIFSFSLFVSENSSSDGSASSTSLLVALAFKHHYVWSFCIFCLLREFALRQALPPCCWTNHGMNMLKHEHWNDSVSLPYPKNFWVIRPVSLGSTSWCIWFFLASNSLCSLKLRKEIKTKGVKGVYTYPEMGISASFSRSNTLCLRRDKLPLSALFCVLGEISCSW